MGKIGNKCVAIFHIVPMILSTNCKQSRNTYIKILLAPEKCLIIYQPENMLPSLNDVTFITIYFLSNINVTLLMPFETGNIIKIILSAI